MSSAQEVMTAIKELREEVELKTKDMGKIDKIEKFLDEQEEKSKKFQEELDKKAAAEKAQEEKIIALEQKLSNIEKDMVRPRGGDNGQDRVLSDEMKSYNKLVLEGGAALTAEERKYLRTNSGQEGGFLVPVDYVRDINKGITEISPIRTLARVRSTTANEVHLPKRTSLLSAAWVAEGKTGTASNSKYGLEKIMVHKMMVPVEVTYEQLSDAAFNIESEILSDVQEEFARLEGLAFVSGTNVAQPEGILTNSGIGYYASGTDGSITADSVIAMAGEIKTGYNLTYLFNRKTRAQLRLLKTGDGQYIWQPGLGVGNPSTLNGLPYVEVPDMPDIGSGTYPIALGDWRRVYTIVDNISMEMIRDNYTLADSAKVRFVFFKRVGGAVTLVEGAKKLKCSAS